MALYGVVLLAWLWIIVRGEEMIQVPCVFMDTCVLPCSFEDEEEKPQVIEWIKEGGAVVHAVQNGADVLKNQNEAFRGRTSLFPEQISGGNAPLQLSAVMVRDQGKYQCNIIGTDFDKSIWVNLSVESSVTAVTLEEKGDLLVCSSEGIFPQPNISWSPPCLCGPTQVEQTENQLYAVSSSRLLGPLFNPQQFTCNVSTLTSWKSATYSLQPLMAVSPKVTIPCVDSTVPEKSLKWTFNYFQTIVTRRGADVTYTAPWRPFVEGVSESGSLILKELSQEQEGVFVCELHTEDTTYFSRTELGNTDHTSLNSAGIGVTVAFIIILITVVIIFLMVRFKKKKEKRISEERELLPKRDGKTNILHCMLQGIFEELSKDELERFKRLLSDQRLKGEFPIILRTELEEEEDLSEAMITVYGIYSISVTTRVLQKLGRNDLLQFLKGDLSDGNMSPEEWSALSFPQLSSNSDMEEFDLRKYCPTEKGLLNLLPVVKGSVKANLSSCGLSQKFCVPLASVLSSSSLKHLNLSNNDLQDSGVELLCDGLTSTSCRLKTLNLALCVLSHRSCAPLASVLKSSSLKHLDLSNNDLQDSGVEQLCEGLRSLSCRLKFLGLSGCLISERGGAALTTALSSTFSHLRELDLSCNHTGASAENLTALLEKRGPHCHLRYLRLEPDGEQFMVPGLKKYACDFSLEPNTAHRNLHLSEDNRTVTYVWEEQPYEDHEDRFTHWEQVLSSTCLTGRSYWEVHCSGRRWKEVVSIAVSYKGIKRTGNGRECVFGVNDRSWSLCIRENHYIVRHNGTETVLSYQFSLKVGVFLDFEAGTLSFYQILPDGELCHIHTFNAAFSEPLFVGFEVGYDSAVTLVKMNS